ncbi:MAG: sensor histidine kinase [Candidatus Margulisiibacteriota bacterium]|nr:sensor histidine kinase [Candidatus Margulisiibacteriota bacterium]
MLVKWKQAIVHLTNDQQVFVNLSESIYTYRFFYQSHIKPILTEDKSLDLDELRKVQTKNKDHIFKILYFSRKTIFNIDSKFMFSGLSSQQYQAIADLYRLQDLLTQELTQLDYFFNQKILGGGSVNNNQYQLNTLDVLNEQFKSIDLSLWKIKESFSVYMDDKNQNLQLLISILAIVIFGLVVFMLIGFYKTIYVRLKHISTVASSIRNKENITIVNQRYQDEIGAIEFELYALHQDLTNKQQIIADREQLLKDKSDRLVKLNQKLVNIIESERRDIAQLIHNDVGQHLIAIKFELEWLQRQPLTLENISHCLSLIHESMDQVKITSKTILPPRIKELGLEQSLNQLIQQFNQYPFEIQFNYATQLNGLNVEVMLSIYRCVQECLTNIVKHAQATFVEINISENEKDVFVSVIDNGVGLKESFTHSTGLTSIEMRVEFLGGKFMINNNKTKGVNVKLEIPKGEKYDKCVLYR